jgi:SAM-dependent methyltransferase
MKPLSRRSVTAGMIAGVTTIPAVGFAKGTTERTQGDQVYKYIDLNCRGVGRRPLLVDECSGADHRLRPDRASLAKSRSASYPFGKMELDLSNIPLPPPNMRRGTSTNVDNSFFVASGTHHAKQLIESCNLGSDSSLLDIGCGGGKLLYGIIEALGSIRSYVGVDVDKRHIDWLKANVAPQVPFARFEHIIFYNERYNDTPSASTRSPNIPGESYDVVALFSVFSHMWLRDIELYLKLIASKLATGGACYLTLFVEDNVPTEQENPPNYLRQWKGRLHCVRINRDAFEQAVARSGLSIRKFTYRGSGTPQSSYVLGLPGSTIQR